jgi:3-phenylpropionate/trans-cinnamate dioxygenase ferredoxin reductase subunit
VAAGLRDAGFDGSITLLGAEPEAPYERPHLSKGYLAGTVAREKLPLRPAAQYRDLGVELLLHERVVELDLDRRTLRLESGGTLPWDRLCIATGSDARRIDGYDAALYLRELPQAERLLELIERRQALDIVGAGFIGCEVAAVAVQKGCEIRLSEALEQPMVHVLGLDVGAYLAGVHRAHGVDLRLNVRATPPSSDSMLIAVGSAPRTDLAERAGLTVDGGIVVDEFGRTGAADVFAAGDVTKFISPLFETRIRVEHFQTSQRQGFAVGRVMAGATQPYDEAPWFWSDQYDLNIQYAGASLPFDEEIVRGKIGKPPFTVLRRRGGRLMTVMGFNDHHTVARARRLMEARKSVSAEQLADPAFDLRRALA